MATIGLTLDVEKRLIASYKTEAHAYLRQKGYKVPTPSHSPSIYVHLGQDKIYCEGKGCRGAIPKYGERWYTKNGKPLKVKYGAINIAERTFDDMIEVVVHEIFHIGPERKGFADETYRNIAYEQIEKILKKVAVPDTVKAITPGALLRFKGYYLQAILYYYGKEKHDLFDTVTKHFGAFIRLLEAFRLIKEKFSRARLRDDKRLSKFSKTKAQLSFQVARQGGYYFNRIAERVENPLEIEVLAGEEALGNDAELGKILKDAYDFSRWKKSLGVRFRDEPFWKY